METTTNPLPDPDDELRDLADLVDLAARPEALETVLGRALEALEAIIPYDLAAVLSLDGAVLRLRAARGPLATDAVRRHAIRLADFPTIRRALELRRPVAMLEHHHASGEGDPYDGVLDLPDGHSCMVVPLFAGDRSLGAITFDRAVCEVYQPALVTLAGVYGQIVALAMLVAEQAARLDEHARGLEARVQQVERDSGVVSAVDSLKRLPSPVMRELVARARLVAATDTAVLIGGETGVGKEVLARAIHAWSRRSRGPFVALNCAAIPDGLVESELFGHTKGAFTGAIKARDGRFQLASHGTLLLDEIGELPLSAQAKLLRVLQEGVVEPVGADRSVPVDVRIIASSHVDLANAVRAGRFREDLYYRLAVFPLQLAPLRERREDVGPLAIALLADLSRRQGRSARLNLAAIEELGRAPWPGNVRELRNALERALIVTPGAEIGPDAFDRTRPTAPKPALIKAPTTPAVTLAEAERAHIARVLLETRGKLYGPGGAAALLDVPPSTLQSRMEKLGLRREQFTAR